MATGFSDYEIVLGTSVTVTEVAPILDIGGVGDILALRTLTHPDTESFPPLTYSNNPDLTSNLLDEALPFPIASTKRTIGTTLVTRFTETISDTIIEETWNGTFETKAAMPGYFLRQLYNYVINPPAIVPNAQTYIVWAPRDASEKSYNVELYQIRVGGASGSARFNLKEIRYQIPSTIDNGLGQWDVAFTGMIDQKVIITMKIVSEVS
jgi:hypothetical protein